MYEITALVTAAALIMFMVLMFNVGKARGKYGIKAPATVGNEAFERVYRVQMNTLEQLVMFLPAFWMFSLYVNPRWGAMLGVVWIIGRALYARDYYADAAKRGRGFMIGMMVLSILLLGSIIGAFLHL